MGTLLFGMDNRTNKEDQLIEKGEVTGMRPGSEVIQTEKAAKEPAPEKTDKALAVKPIVRVLSEEEPRKVEENDGVWSFFYDLYTT